MDNKEFDLWQRPKFRLLNEEQIEKIYDASLEVLEKTGTVVKHKEALEMLDGAGAKVVDKERVKIPSHIVEEALKNVNSSVVISNRDGDKSMYLEGDNVYFGPGSETPYVLDLYTGKRRKSVKNDTVMAAKVIDFLTNIDFAMSFGLATDIQNETCDAHHFEAMVLNTNKPIIFTAYDKEGVDYIFKMACVAAGGEKQFRENPFILHYAEPTSPLIHSEPTIDNLFACVERDIPVMYVPGASMGGTAPMTFAGGYVQSNAEFLVGLILTQLKKKGAKILFGGGVNPLDMKTMTFSYGAPEAWISRVIRKELAEYIGVPVFATGGCTDAKIIDQQAAIEAANSLMLSALSGQNLIHDVGYIDSGLTSSLEMLLMADEIIATIKRVLKSLRVNKDTLAVDVINEVGPGKDYLSHEHTYKHFKEVLFQSDLLTRDNYDNWARKGSKSMGDLIKEKVIDILETHEGHRLNEDQEKEIKKLLAESDINRKRETRKKYN
jgi:trimethylamine---corrinoid protein Co-methyltransferase